MSEFLEKLNKSELWVAIGTIVGIMTKPETGDRVVDILTAVVPGIVAAVYVIARTFAKKTE